MLRNTLFGKYTLRIACTATLTTIGLSTPSLADDWATVEKKLFSAREQWEHTCEVQHCMGPGSHDTDNDIASKALGQLIEAWAEGQAKILSGATPQEVTATNNAELNSLVQFMVGRWVGTTSWGNHDAVGEQEGIAIDFQVERSAGGYRQRTTHPGIGCTSSGEYSRFRRGGVRFHNSTDQGPCRDVEIGVRVFDDGSLKWTRFVSDWPVAWGTLVPVK